MAIQRLCKCGCGTQFVVPARRPATEYSYGHRPCQARKSAAVAAAEHVLGRSAKERRVLDYRIALQTARVELKSLAADIDEVDEQIASLREAVNAREAHKEKVTDRHLTVATSISILEALIDGKSVRELATGDGAQ